MSEVDDLFVRACAGAYDDERAWEAVSKLRVKGSREVFEAAKAFLQSDRPRARARALDVLGQLGARTPQAERPYLDECVSLAIKHVADGDAEVLNSAAWALAHLGSERGIATLRGLKRHPNADVRHAVAYGLGGRTDEESLETLFELMEDENGTVRDWATFGVGWLGTCDSPQVREALRGRLNDACEDARREAIWGLAKRRDQGGVRLLLEILEGAEWWQGDEDAACEVLRIEGAPVEDLREGLRGLLK